MTHPVLEHSELEKFAEELSAPLPADFGSAKSFERWILGGLVPLLGLNLYLFGCYLLLRLDTSRALAAAASAIFGLAAVALVLRRAKQPSYSDFFGVGLSGLVLGAAVLPGLLVVAVAVSALSFTAWLVSAGKAHGRAFVLLAAWLVPILKVGGAPSPFSIAALSLLPCVLVLVKSRYVGAAFAVLAVALVAAGLELEQRGGGTLTAFGLGGVVLIVAIAYESLVPTGEHSTFRVLLVQSAVVGALVVLVSAVMGKDSSGRVAVWIWAGLTMLYQGLRLAFETERVLARGAWLGLAFASLLLTQKTAWQVIVCELVALSGVLHLAAIRLRAGVLADTGVLLLGAALSSLPFLDVSKRIEGIVTGLVAASALVLASRRFPIDTPLPWWSGFVRKSHAELVRNNLSRALKWLSELSLFKLFLGWLSFVTLWLRFANADPARAELRRTLNFIGHGYIAVFVLPALVDWLGSRLQAPESTFEAAVGAFFGVTYGVLLVARGVGLKRSFSRNLGIAVLLSPAIRAALHASIPTADAAWLLLVTGVGLAGAGLLIKTSLAASSELA
jgi:hypothetical protein